MGNYNSLQMPSRMIGKTLNGKNLSFHRNLAPEVVDTFYVDHDKNEITSLVKVPYEVDIEEGKIYPAESEPTRNENTFGFYKERYGDSDVLYVFSEPLERLSKDLNADNLEGSDIVRILDKLNSDHDIVGVLSSKESAKGTGSLLYPNE